MLADPEKIAATLAYPVGRLGEYAYSRSAIVWAPGSRPEVIYKRFLRRRSLRNPAFYLVVVPGLGVAILAWTLLAARIPEYLSAAIAVLVFSASVVAGLSSSARPSRIRWEDGWAWEKHELPKHCRGPVYGSLGGAVGALESIQNSTAIATGWVSRDILSECHAMTWKAMNEEASADHIVQDLRQIRDKLTAIDARLARETDVSQSLRQDSILIQLSTIEDLLGE